MMMSDTNKPTDLSMRWTLGTLLVLCFFLFFYRLGSYPFFDIDEPRYAEAAREMLESGNWITPYFNYELRLEKPVFFYWLAALSYKVFGIGEFGARFASAAMAAIMVLATFGFGRALISNRFGFYAALILATSIQVFGLARMSITDMTLASLMALTTLSLFLVAHKNLKFWLLAGLFAGLAILTKGLVGIVLPGGVLVLYALWTGQLKRVLLNRWFALALLVAAAVSLPWYVLAYQQNGQIFLDSLVFNNVDRFSSVVTGHDQDRFQFGPVNVFFVVVLLVGFMPWTAYLPVAFWKGRKLQAEDNSAHNMLSFVTRFAMVWVTLIFVFFSFSQTKLLTYILPLFPGLSLWLAAVFYRARQNQDPNLTRAFAVSGWVLFAVLGVVAVTALALKAKIAAAVPVEAQYLVQNPLNVFAVLTLVVGVGCVALLMSKKQITQALLAQAITMVFVGVIALHHIVPAVNEVMQGDMLSFVKTIGDKPVAVYEIQRPSLTFYARKQVPHIKHDEYDRFYQLLSQNQQKTGETVLYVITKNKYLQQLENLEPAKATVQLLENGPVYSLLAVEKSK